MSAQNRSKTPPTCYTVFKSTVVKCEIAESGTAILSMNVYLNKLVALKILITVCRRSMYALRRTIFPGGWCNLIAGVCVFSF